jgi:hypothetical protein
MGKIKQKEILINEEIVTDETDEEIKAQMVVQDDDFIDEDLKDDYIDLSNTF